MVASGELRSVPLRDGMDRFRQGLTGPLSVPLDESQRRLVDVVTKGGGAYLIKGAAGTGKSTVLLHAIKSLRRDGVPPKSILYATYTKALVTTVEAAMKRDPFLNSKTITKKSVDAVAWKVAGMATHSSEIVVRDGDNRLVKPLTEAMEGVRASLNPALRAAFGRLVDKKLSRQYLIEEIERTIIAQDLRKPSEYASLVRQGRITRLTEDERAFIWQIHLRFVGRLRDANLTTWSRLRQKALRRVEEGKYPERFDAVFIDEAQDLEPTAMRLLVELCRKPEGGNRKIVLSADANQTIYGNGYSWVSIHPDLRLTGRSHSLTTNHRCTRQIVLAAESYLQGAELEDERVAEHHIYTGPLPLVWPVTSEKNEVTEIEHFFRTAGKQLNLTFDQCAVLVPTRNRGKEIASALCLRGVNAQFMIRSEVDLTFPGVKVLTRHTAKGLEFPVVAVALFEQLKQPGTGPEELSERLLLERRVNHMAMTRAMQMLMVTVPASPAEGRFVGLTAPLWLQGGKNMRQNPNRK